ncbi:hypothetical protein AYI68_g3015 [Smittium mucronatum]|uniref:Uncharacterized protein n=1 Tax=Smittium mucronatum TaxID=133383 RepID=A0A1R0H144_9FUNG|nr:hypothetical protein AYI68_g3015 [Smittium mucronatum]
MEVESARTQIFSYGRFGEYEAHRRLVNTRSLDEAAVGGEIGGERNAERGPAGRVSIVHEVLANVLGRGELDLRLSLFLGGKIENHSGSYKILKQENKTIEKIKKNEEYSKREG